MWKFIKMLIAVLLWPLAWAVSTSTYTLCRPLTQSPAESGWQAWALPAGFLLWVLVFFILPRPFRTYVLGHELTHALWAMMMGGRVGKIKVGRRGGHVELSKTNFIITLAPYFFPFYTVLVITAYYLAGHWLNVEEHAGWWLSAVGLTWSFHLTFTIHMLSQRQPDVQEHGAVFSITVIYIMNVLVIALMAVLLGDARLLRFGNLLGVEAGAAYTYTFAALERGWNTLAPFFENMRRP